jgi:peptidoglycan/xylan/chitin deacetylase (PgdA/CDA1 family)
MTGFRSKIIPRPRLAIYQPALAGADTVRWETLPQWLCNNAGTLIEDFSAASDWIADLGAAPVDDAVKVVAGSQSITWSPAGTNHRIHKVVNWDLSSAADRNMMEIWVYATGTGTVEIFASNLDTAALTKYIKFNAAIALTNTWQCIRMPSADWTGAAGGFSWSLPILSIHFRYSGTNTINLDAFRKGLDYIPAAVTSFDDCLSSVWTAGRSIFDAHNAACTVFMVGDYIGTGSYLTAAQLADMAAAGWIVGNHTDTHPHLNTLTQAQIETELNNAAAALTAAGAGAHGLHYSATPWGEWDADIDAAHAALGFRFSRLVTTAYQYGGLRFWDGTPPRSQYRVPGSGIWANIGALLAYVDWAKKYQAVIQIYAHQVEAPDGANKFSPSMLETYLAYLTTQSVQHLTYEDMYQLTQGSWTVRIIK